MHPHKWSASHWWDIFFLWIDVISSMRFLFAWPGNLKADLMCNRISVELYSIAKIIHNVRRVKKIMAIVDVVWCWKKKKNYVVGNWLNSHRHIFGLKGRSFIMFPFQLFQYLSVGQFSAKVHWGSNLFMCAHSLIIASSQWFVSCHWDQTKIHLFE